MHLSLINHSCAKRVTPHGKTVRIHMPYRQIPAMLCDKNERWRGQLWFCMQCDTNGARECGLAAPEVSREKNAIAGPK
jgi:hypothetical protein